MKLGFILIVLAPWLSLNAVLFVRWGYGRAARQVLKGIWITSPLNPWRRLSVIPEQNVRRLLRERT